MIQLVLILIVMNILGLSLLCLVIWFGRFLLKEDGILEALPMFIVLPALVMAIVFFNYEMICM